MRGNGQGEGTAWPRGEGTSARAENKSLQSVCQCGVRLLEGSWRGNNPFPDGRLRKGKGSGGLCAF